MSTLAEWDSNYNRANNAAQDIQDMIAQRDQQRRAGGGGSNSGIRPALNTLDRSLDKLDAALRQFEAAPPLGAREDLRRLQNERTRLKSLEKTSITSSDRDSLLRAAGGSAKAEAAETVATRDLTTQQLVERTQAEMKMQDEVLEDMSTGLTSLHKVSTAIKDEVTLHVELLDDFERKVDEGTANLQSETDRAKHITKASATCWLYIVICLLLLVLVVLIAVRWV